MLQLHDLIRGENIVHDITAKFPETAPAAVVAKNSRRFMDRHSVVITGAACLPHAPAEETPAQLYLLSAGRRGQYFAPDA